MAGQINTQKIGIFSVIGVGLLFAWLSGSYIADEDFFPIATALGVLLVLGIVFGLGSSIYILIPICWGLYGKISVLPLPFSVMQLTVILASLVYIFTLVFKLKNMESKIDYIDIIVWINIIYVATTFIRNPVGFASIGGGLRVGGKPYIDVILGLMTYIMLSNFSITPKFSKKLPVISLWISFFNCFAGSVQLFFPNVGAMLGNYYSEFAALPGVEIQSEKIIAVGETRFEFLQQFGLSIILYIVAQISPLALLSVNRLKQLIFYSSGYIMILLSGFRNALFSAFLYSIFSAYIREKFIGILKVVFLTFSVIILSVLASYTPIKTPLTFQRALSFLPGDWDESAVGDAKNSSEWRFEMWEIALTSDKYIQNKLFGDGFGFLRADYERGLDISMGKTVLSPVEAQQEIFLLDGDYHSGPVGSIRFVGYVGLVLFILLLIELAKLAMRTIKCSLGSPYEFCVLYYAIPAVILPFFFLFIFGDYRKDIVTVLFDIGIFKMLNKSIRNRN